MHTLDDMNRPGAALLAEFLWAPAFLREGTRSPRSPNAARLVGALLGH